MIVVKIADTQQEINEIGELRYRRICEELHYKDPSLFPNHKEFDKFDEFSVHFAVLKDNKIIATDRLVKDSDYGFPMEEKIRLPSYLERGKLTEVSRLVTDKEFSYNPYILLKLFGENYKYSKVHGITHWCAAVEESLLESLLKIGFCFTIIGPKFYFNGSNWAPKSHTVPVVPVLLNLREAEIYLQSTNPKLYEKITGNQSQKISCSEKERVKIVNKRTMAIYKKIQKSKI